ncbi:hypothetical protein GE09DRAFT_1163593 [Coniochaeta sp. 2T2.1]|nr:hypothetical protein GE09DRAFT_1163593 [Coniochaeta sp. 2T2.1]
MTRRLLWMFSVGVGRCGPPAFDTSGLRSLILQGRGSGSGSGNMKPGNDQSAGCAFSGSTLWLILGGPGGGCVGASEPRRRLR